MAPQRGGAASDDGADHLESLEADPIPTEKLGSRGPQDVGKLGYDVSPDGQRFLLIKEGAGLTDSSEPTHNAIHIVLNWFQELRERVPVD